MININPKHLALLLKLRKIASPKDYADLVKSLFSNAPEDVKSRVYQMADAVAREDVGEEDKIRAIGMALGLCCRELDEFVEYVASMKEYIKLGVKYISTGGEI